MKRFAVCLLSALMLLALLCASASAEKIYRGDEVFSAMPLFDTVVYTKPSEKSEILCDISAGSRVDVVGYSDAWAEVQAVSGVRRGMIGYIPRHELVNLDWTYEAYTTDVINSMLIKDGAYTNKIATLSAGREVYVVGYIRNWPNMGIRDSYIITDKWNCNKHSRFLIVPSEFVFVWN